MKKVPYQKNFINNSTIGHEKHTLLEKLTLLCEQVLKNLDEAAKMPQNKINAEDSKT